MIRILFTFSLFLSLCLVNPPLQAQNRGWQNLNQKWSKTNQPKTPEDLNFERDVDYRKGHDRWVMNIISAKEKSHQTRPAIVVIHGGGWSGNDHYRFSSLGFRLAREGYVIFTPTHRMIRDAPFPACLQDIKTVVRWIRAHAKEYQVNPDKIGAYGNSSGGHLALMTGLTGKEDQYNKEGPHQEFSSEIQAVVCSGTVGDMTHADHSDLAKRVYRALAQGRNQKLSEQETMTTMKQASPITYVSKETPPIVMIHGEKDGTVHIASTDLFVKKMKAAGAKINYLRYEDGGHGVMFQKQAETLPAMLKIFEEQLKK
jgi:acetyl esterase/lipase